VRREQRTASLSAHALADSGTAFQALLAADGWADLRRFIVARNLPIGFSPAADDGTLRIGSEAAPIFVSAATIARVRDSLTRHLAAWHQAHPDRMGLGKAELLRGASEVPPNIAEAVLNVLHARGTVARDGLSWRLPEHSPVLAPEDEARWTRVHAILAAAGLRPPRVRELAAELRLAPEDMEALLLRIERFGRLAAVASNRFFLPETILALGEVADALAAESEEAGFTAAEFNKRSGIGRNLTIIVLEYLDAIGVTRRAGDLRHVVRRPRDAMG
jgi:selenocysteine-specific elongation factor